MRDQLDDAAVATSRAISSVRRANHEDEDGSRTGHGSMDDMISEKNKEKDEKKVSNEILVMQPILRFLQLLCENHNRELQV